VNAADDAPAPPAGPSVAEVARAALDRERVDTGHLSVPSIIAAYAERCVQYEFERRQPGEGVIEAYYAERDDLLAWWASLDAALSCGRPDVRADGRCWNCGCPNPEHVRYLAEPVTKAGPQCPKCGQDHAVLKAQRAALNAMDDASGLPFAPHGYTCDLCGWGRDKAHGVEEYAVHLRRAHCGPASQAGEEESRASLLHRIELLTADLDAAEARRAARGPSRRDANR
jgi:hypothetical protein